MRIGFRAPETFLDIEVGGDTERPKFTLASIFGECEYQHADLSIQGIALPIVPPLHGAAAR